MWLGLAASGPTTLPFFFTKNRSFKVLSERKKWKCVLFSNDSGAKYELIRLKILRYNANLRQNINYYPFAFVNISKTKREKNEKKRRL